MNTKRKISSLCFLIIVSILLNFCAEDNTGIRIAVAANFASTMSEIVDSFHVKYPGTEITIIQGSSGKLAGQILNGAKYDIFLSADSSKPALLFEAGYTKQQPVTYAFGSLILFTKNDLILSKNLRSLEYKTINHVAIANPLLAPYGKAAFEAIKNSGIDFDITKIVYGENILQTFQHIDLAADVGFISKSLICKDIAAKKYLVNIHWVDVDTNLYSPIKQNMILLNENSETSRNIYQYISSQTAKDIISKSGYKL